MSVPFRGRHGCNRTQIEGEPVGFALDWDLRPLVGDCPVWVENGRRGRAASPHVLENPQPRSQLTQCQGPRMAAGGRLRAGLGGESEPPERVAGLPLVRGAARDRPHCLRAGLRGAREQRAFPRRAAATGRDRGAARRRLYVALTRARDTLLLQWPEYLGSSERTNTARYSSGIAGCHWPTGKPLWVGRRFPAV